jgi:hypothetical protein
MVHVELLDDAGQSRLIVSGPTDHRQASHFVDEASVNAFLDGLRGRLEGEGFQLIASVERRRGDDRRASRRGGPDRRRASR